MDDHGLNDAFAVPSLGERVAPRIRGTIANAIASAIGGNLSVALTSLEDSASDRSKADVIARALSRSLVLHWNREGTRALTELDDVALPNSHELPEEIRIVIEQNRLDVAFSSGLPTGEDVKAHYGQVDRRKLHGLSFRDANALLDAAEASAAGKNYDSLPIYHLMLCDAYRYFNWRTTCQSAGQLCRELVRLREPAQAVFFGILSQEKPAAHLIADHVRTANDPALLEATLERLSALSHLSRHVTFACEFLTQLGDAIPDSAVAIWLERLQSSRRLPGKTFPERWASDPAWAATTALLYGAGAPQADAIVDEVLAHPRWRESDINRIDFYEPLSAAAHAASEEGCRRLMDAVIPHVATSSPGHDFDRALDLLDAVAQRYPGLKKHIAETIYKTKTGLNHLLVASAPAFDVQLRVEDPEKLVRIVVGHLRLQVERLTDGAAPHAGHGEMMIHNKPGPRGAIAVKFGSCAQELQAIATHRKDIPSPLLAELTTAIIETIKDEDNINQNRVMLFCVLGQLADAVDEEAAKGIIVVAERFAADHRITGHPLHGQEEEYAKLNPFRIDGGWPQDVRGIALLVLARIARHQPKLVSSLKGLIRSAMADPNPVVRRHGYQAVAIAGAQASDCLPMVVGGTRDADPDAANIALQVVGAEAESVNSQGLVALAVGVIESQNRHPDIGVRLATARVARQLLRASKDTNSEEFKRLSAVTERMKFDISRRVRGAVAHDADAKDR